MRLSDGVPVAVRPIRPEDRDALAEAFARLSPESRYRRFFTPVNQLSERTLSFLTEVDHQSHEALVAYSDDGRLVGVARYVRASPEARVAEAAITVIDDWQGRGLGRGLLQRLAARAREDGVKQFSALVKVENPTAVEVLRSLGPSELTRQGDEYRLLIDLPARGVGTKLAHTLRAAAAGTVSLADSVARAAIRRPPNPDA